MTSNDKVTKSNVIKNISTYSIVKKQIITDNARLDYTIDKWKKKNNNLMLQMKNEIELLLKKSKKSNLGYKNKEYIEYLDKDNKEIKEIKEKFHYLNKINHRDKENEAFKEIYIDKDKSNMCFNQNNRIQYRYDKYKLDNLENSRSIQYKNRNKLKSNIDLKKDNNNYLIIEKEARERTLSTVESTEAHCFITRNNSSPCLFEDKLICFNKLNKKLCSYNNQFEKLLKSVCKLK